MANRGVKALNDDNEKLRNKNYDLELENKRLKTELKNKDNQIRLLRKESADKSIVIKRFRDRLRREWKINAKMLEALKETKQALTATCDSFCGNADEEKCAKCGISKHRNKIKEAIKKAENPQ